MTDLRYGLWSLYVQAQAASANAVHWDLWNGSDRDLTVSSVVAIKSPPVAVSGLVSLQMHLTRTSSVGTGGTAATEEGVGLATTTITMLQQRALPTGVSARVAPTGGGTAGPILCERNLFPEETNSANYEPLEFLSSLLTVPEGTGLRIIQGGVATVGNVSYNVIFY